MQADLNYMAIQKNVCDSHSIMGMKESFNKDTFNHTLQLMSENQYFEEILHYDTLNY